MVNIIGYNESESRPDLSFCDQPVSRLHAQDKRGYKELGLSEEGGIESPENQEKLLKCLKQTNRICSPFFATFVPVQPDRWKDVFLPLSTNYIKNVSGHGMVRFLNVLRTTGIILADVFTIPIRLLTVIPRSLTESLMYCNRPTTSPIKKLAARGGKNPCLIAGEKQSFYFSLTPMHASEAPKIFHEKNSEFLESKKSKLIFVYKPEYEDQLYPGLSSPNEKFQEIERRIRAAVQRMSGIPESNPS